MSTMETRVADFGQADIDKRHAILAKLDPAIARRYAIAVDGANKDRLDKGQPLAGQGEITRTEVDDILDVAFGTHNRSAVTKQEEEALIMILSAPAGKIRWAADAKQYMVARVEEKLRDLWSVRAIVPNYAAQYLALAGKVSFKSQGKNYRGTRVEYSPQCYQDVLRALRTYKLSAWWIPSIGLFRQTAPGQQRVAGVYYSESNDLFVLTGLPQTVRAATFVHEVTHVIQDFRNVRAKTMYIEADAHIADAVAAWQAGAPYGASGSSTEAVATRGAAKLLMANHRGRTWDEDFRKAYDDVVDAVILEYGSASAEQVKSMKEGESWVADRELKLLTGIHAAAHGRRRR